MKLKYHRTHNTTISPSKWRPANNSSTETNRDPPPFFADTADFAPEPAQARSLFRRAVGIWEASVNPDCPEAATALNNLGAADLHLRQYEQARDFIDRGLKLRQRLLAPRHPDIAQSLYNHAVVLEKLGERKAARSAFRQAASIRSDFASENLLGLTVDVKALGEC